MPCLWSRVNFYMCFMTKDFHFQMQIKLWPHRLSLQHFLYLTVLSTENQLPRQVVGCVCFFVRVISISHSVAVWPLNPHRRGWWNATPHEALWILGESDPCFMSSLSAVKQAWAHSNIAHTPAFISFTSGSSSTVAPPLPHSRGTSTWLLLYAERCCICTETHSSFLGSYIHLRQTFCKLVWMCEVVGIILGILSLF